MNDFPPIYKNLRTIELHVGWPIPRPKLIELVVMRVSPDLARYLLTFNHPKNRSMRARSIESYRRQMSEGLWDVGPQPLTFAHGPEFIDGVLCDGQNRLRAVIEYGGPVWMTATFGWPESVIYIIDNNKPRNAADSLKVSDFPSAHLLAATVNKVFAYEKTAGTATSWGTIVLPAPQEAIQTIQDDDEGWIFACQQGDKTYRALDAGWVPSLWAAAYRIIATRHPELAHPFFEEIRTGSGENGSATRQLRDWAIRRQISLTSTGDRREPMELTIRAFNAWHGGRPFSRVRTAGFTLTRIK